MKLEEGDWFRVLPRFVNQCGYVYSGLHQVKKVVASRRDDRYHQYHIVDPDPSAEGGDFFFYSYEVVRDEFMCAAQEAVNEEV